MFNTPYNRKIKDEMMAIDRAYIAHSKKVSTKGLLNVSGNKIGGAHPVGMSASLGRPIGGATPVDAKFSKSASDFKSGGPIWAMIQGLIRKLKGGARTGGMESDSDTSYTSIEEAQGLHLQANLNNMSLQNLIEMASVPGWVESLSPVLRAIVLRRLTSKRDAPRGGAKSGGRKASPWIEHVKAFAKEKGINYREALRSPECKASYKKVGSGFFSDLHSKFKVKMPTSHPPFGGARTGGKKFKQVGTNIVAEANADLKQSAPPTAATVPPKVGGSAKPTLSAKTQAQLKKEKLKADARVLASELAKLQVAEEDPYMDMSGAKGKAPAVNRATKPKGSGKTGGAKRKPSKWIEHVKAFAAKNGVSYRDALRSPECKASYKK